MTSTVDVVVDSKHSQLHARHRQQHQQQSPSSTNNKINGLARTKRQANNTSGASMVLTTSTAATLSGLFNQQRAKPIRIAPAPPVATTGTGNMGTIQGAGAGAAVASSGAGTTTTLARSEILKLAK